MTDGFTIRRPIPADLGILTELATCTFRETYAHDSDPSQLEAYIAANFTREVFAAQIVDPSSQILLACVHDQLIGYAAMRVGNTPSCVSGPSPVELVRLYLLKSAIGEGYGSRLMDACLQEADRLRYETIWLGVWDGNSRARAFYTKWGFEVVGTNAFMLGGTVYQDPVMARRVKLG